MAAKDTVPEKKKCSRKWIRTKTEKFPRKNGNAFHETRFTETDKNKDGSVTEEESSSYSIKTSTRERTKEKIKKSTAIKTKIRERTKKRIRIKERIKKKKRITTINLNAASV